ncbi:MAG: polyprenol monophosphomannose synthase [Fibrobacter sp.]|jgi:dolichol-phosphate mannosyltransferase|nr:polyprenol monophosphomannose synthase [Fibrobacter sp.]
MQKDQALIIIPTYNERENIVLIIPEIKKVLPQVHILVVDDSSPDGTAQSVREMASTISDVYLLERPQKNGLGRAYISGFQWALQRSYQFIFEMDADFSHDPKYLPDFLNAIKENDLVIGSRYISGVNVINWPMSRLLLSYCGNKFASILTGISVKDCTGGFKCFRRELLEKLDMEKISSSGYSFQVEINYYAWKMGFRIAEIPIVFTDRKFGDSKMSTKIIREAFLLIWKLRLASLFKRNY